LTGRPGGHVGEGECVHEHTIVDREGGQLLDQAALLGLEMCSGVVRDQAG
jgi:hypothetical protein